MPLVYPCARAKTSQHASLLHRGAASIVFSLAHLSGGGRRERRCPAHEDQESSQRVFGQGDEQRPDPRRDLAATREPVPGKDRHNLCRDCVSYRNGSAERERKTDRQTGKGKVTFGEVLWQAFVSKDTTTHTCSNRPNVHVSTPPLLAPSPLRLLMLSA